MLIHLKKTVRDFAHKIDQAITMGVSAMYPLVFSLPAPDPLPDWKRVVKLGWKVVKVTVSETTRVLRENSFPKLETTYPLDQKGLSSMASNITWDVNRRLAVLSRVLITIQGDLANGSYGLSGRPTIYTAVQVIHAEPERLNASPELAPFLLGLDAVENVTKTTKDEEVKS
jgi:hypothetical protein